MATIALDKTARIETAASEAGKAPRRGFFGHIWDTLVEAQEMRASTYIHGYLAHLSDAELARLGMTRDQMIRHTRNLMTRM